MKNQILTFAICILSFFCFAQAKSIKSINIIDVHDSVVYDLFNAVEAGGFVEFPVKFLSGDVINAVDFLSIMTPSLLHTIQLSGSLHTRA